MKVEVLWAVLFLRLKLWLSFKGLHLYIDTVFLNVQTVKGLLSL